MTGKETFKTLSAMMEVSTGFVGRSGQGINSGSFML